MANWLLIMEAIRVHQRQQALMRRIVICEFQIEAHHQIFLQNQNFP